MGVFLVKVSDVRLQKIYRLPEVVGDSIFAVTAEELGFIVTSFLVIVYFFVAYRIFKIAFFGKG